MKRIAFIFIALLISTGYAWGAVYTSDTSLLSGGTLINFEGQSEGTLINTQYAGVTFSQLGNNVVGSFSPMIDNSPFLYGYHASSGTGVLTGSEQGGWPFPTVAPLVATFATGQQAVEFFFSDDSPLGRYTIQAFDADNNLLDQIVLSGSAINVYVGFTELSSVIASVGVSSDKAYNDAYSWDDFRFSSSTVPEPNTLLLIGLGMIGLAGLRKRTK
jgi:hypothetical protein